MLNLRIQYFQRTPVFPRYGILVFSMGSRLRGNDVLALS
jgi:hypothetical protein